MLSKIELRNNNQEQISYYIHIPPKAVVRSAIAYLHGLMSDLSWFQLPAKLPVDTAVIYIRRQPKNHTDNFMEWYENYRLCLDDFIKNYQPEHLHLVANCFGTLPALLWITKDPETFTTVTLSNPVLKQKKNFSKKEIQEIFFNYLLKKKNFRRIYLKTRHFSRIPTVMEFIENTDDTTFEFSDSFFLQVLKLRKWLNKNLIDIGIPVHTIFAYEDEVVDIAAKPKGFWKRVKPSKTTYFHADHFIELQPQKEEFWEEVTGFQKKYECSLAKTNPDHVNTILVTGATGFLGQHICRELANLDFKVVALARDFSKAKEILNEFENIEIREGDLNNLSSLENAMNNIDVVIHSAGLVSDWGNPETFRKSNVEGTKNLLLIAHSKGIKQFVSISSLGIFGDADQDKIDENNQLLYTTDNYSNSKIGQEFFVKKYCLHNKIPFTIIRPGFIYGEGDNNFFPKLIANIEKKKMKFVGSGDNHLNTVYVGNVTSLITRVIGNPVACNQSYNLSDREQVSVRKFINDITLQLNLPRVEKSVSLKTALAITAIFETLYTTLKIKKAPPFTRKKITFMARDRRINSEKAYCLIGGGYISYQEGIERTLNDLKEHGN